MTKNANGGHERHGADPQLAHTVVRYRDGHGNGEPGWHITTDRENGDAVATTGPYPLHELETVLRLVDGRDDDDDHETDLTPVEVAIEEGHVTRIEDEARKVAAALPTDRVEELQVRKDRLAALMTASNDYSDWCEE